MSASIRIRLLEKDNNRRGDLFGKLMADLFVALGYRQPRLNVHKSGRELDLAADHRLERRRAIAECKATADATGGDDLNKFVGALDAERVTDVPISGYFISLSGFKETAIEQERNRSTKLTLLTGPQVVEELVNGRMLIGKERATELAGLCRSGHEDLTLDADLELLGHERGWIWAIHYTQGRERTHFALIHSDGTLLARAVADEIVAADRACGGILYERICLNPTPSASGVQQIIEALGAYWRYLKQECGYVHLDGLPADTDAASRRLRLEAMFVPMHLDLDPPTGRASVGSVLANHPRLAILGPPGSGKSTLLKRLAVAYADASGRGQLADDLPQGEWFPLLIRCRELRALARGSFSDLIEAFSVGETLRPHARALRGYVEGALLGGRVLLLVDGLDEIVDPGDRATFVSTIRTAIQACPGTRLVVTSREAGFQHVAAYLTANITLTTLSPLAAKDIQRLVLAWHHEVLGDSDGIRSSAESVAATIVANGQLRALAANPLLLTTMLMVRRWVGSLATRRALLYGKAVEVLLMTWNVESRDPVPEEEALPQLCFVAAAMTMARVQKISRPRLAKLLQEARAALAVELSHVQGTVDDFISRVEDRSGLLIMTGFEVEDEQLVESFEFCHLTFQEFLTARAIVEGWHPGQPESRDMVTVLEPHFANPEWQEVIRLAAALGGKTTNRLIERLTVLVSGVAEVASSHGDASPLVLALGYCLVDEVPAQPQTIRCAVREIVRSGFRMPGLPFAPELARGLYGAALRKEAGDAFVERTGQFGGPAAALGYVVRWQTAAGDDRAATPQAARQFLALLTSERELARCEGALGLATLWQRRPERYWSEVVEALGAAVVEMLFRESAAEVFAASRALYALGNSRIWSPSARPDVLGRLFTLWQHSDDAELRGAIPSTIYAQQLMPRDGRERFCSTIRREEFESLAEEWGEGSSDEATAIVVIAWYLGTPWGDSELARHARELIEAESDQLAGDAQRALLGVLDQLGRRY
jgi:energy-coupling factor transporter ATP-binding protein EcfA2